jgi:predicted MFS family arabinose efflux permease
VSSASTAASREWRIRRAGWTPAHHRQRSAPYRTCIAATIPQIVPDERFPAANAARSFATEASVVIGPLLSAGLLLIGRPGAAFLLNAATFLTAAALLTRMTPSAFTTRGPSSLPSLRRELATGARALRDHPRTWPVCGADILGSGVYGTATVLLLYLSRDLTGSDAGYGLIFRASGLGGMAGALLTSRAMTVVTPQRLLAVSLGATALPLAVAGAIDGTSWFVLALFAMAVFGAAGVSVEIQADSILQRAIPAEAFGRAYGFIVPACYAAQAVGAGIAPAAASALGLTGAFTASAALLLVYTVMLGWRRSGRSRRSARRCG